jgi:hypothetical protein
MASALAEAGFYVLRYDNRATDDSPGMGDLTFADRITCARAAIAFLRRRFDLEAVVGWGICMAGTILLHCGESGVREETPDGLVLCNVLASPDAVWKGRIGLKDVPLRNVTRQIFFRGNMLRKLWEAPRKLHIYRENLLRLVEGKLARFQRPDPEVERIRAGIGTSGRLLAKYPGPCLMIFGEKDPSRKLFFEEVNPGDRLGLAKKALPPDWAVVSDGDHTFASREQTADLIRYTLDWIEKFRRERLSTFTPSIRGEHGIPSPPFAH